MHQFYIVKSSETVNNCGNSVGKRLAGGINLEEFGGACYFLLIFGLN